MGYRGDDLDLRTPQAGPGDAASVPRSESSVRARSTADTGRAAPIWVDDDALDCCNHAYDVAAAHRAGEVRVEHLIYALTRDDAAADAFERQGIRPKALRREAAAIIATEIPAVSSNGKTAPRRADALEQLLRLAATHAYRRQAPVSVSDIVNVLVEGDVEVPTMERLIARAPAAPPPETFEAELIRERVRGNSHASPPPQPAPQPARIAAADLASLTTTSFTQTTRIDAIEHAVRTLTTELANERKVLSGVLQDLQRELMAQREDTSRLGGISPDKIQAVLGDRLQNLEQALLSARTPGVSELQERIAVLERTLMGEISNTRTVVESIATKPDLDLAPLSHRLEVIDATLAAERERSQTRDDAFAATLDDQPARILEPLGERFEVIATTQETRHSVLNEGLAEAHARLQAVEEALGAYIARLAESEETSVHDRTALREQVSELAAAFANAAEANRTSYTRLTETLAQDLTELHDGIGKTHTSHQALTTAFDAQSDDLANAFATLAGRIDSLERATARPVEMLQTLSATVDKMHRITVERYYRRNRFWYWLFGTDDWLAASWPSQSARIAEELRAIKR